MLILTNNSKVKAYFEERLQVIYEACSPGELLKQARDLIHQGHELLTHPLAGSIKPNVAPYKSIALGCEKKKLDFPSLLLIEEAIHAYETVTTSGLAGVQASYTQSMLDDFKEVDLALIKGAAGGIR